MLILEWLGGRPDRRPVPGASTDGKERLGARQPVILAVDDEHDALDFLHTLLTPEGFDFVGATSGAQAFSMIQQRRPDLVIVDVMMAGMNGLELCDLLRSDVASRDLPIVLYSAYDMNEHSNTGLYDAAFIKPAEPDELIGAIRSLLPA